MPRRRTDRPTQTAGDPPITALVAATPGPPLSELVPKKPALKRKTFQKFVEKELLRYAPEITKKLFNSLGRSLDSDKHTAQQLVAEMLGMAQRRSGINVTTQILNQNANVQAGGAKYRSYESAIEAIESEERERATRVIEMPRND